MALSRMEGVEWDRDAIELSGLVFGEGLWGAIVPRLLCNRSGQNMDDRCVTQKERLSNELICLCKYTHVLSSRYKVSLLRGPFTWPLLGLRLIEIFPGAGVT